MMKRGMSVLACVWLGLVGCTNSSSGKGEAGFESSGSCADFTGTYEGQFSCSDGTSETRSSSVTQNGCTLAITNTSDGTTHSWKANGNTAVMNVNDDGVTGQCQVTLSGSAYTQSCNLTSGGQKITCTGSGMRAGGGEGGAGGYGGSGGEAGGSGGATTGGGGEQCGVLYSDNASCDQCMQSSCCAELWSCSPGTGCYDLAMCINTYCASATSECLQKYCGAELESGGSALLDLADCSSAECASCS